jgi:hypothetical protein
MKTLSSITIDISSDLLLALNTDEVELKHKDFFGYPFVSTM